MLYEVCVLIKNILVFNLYILSIIRDFITTLSLYHFSQIAHILSS